MNRNEERTQAEEALEAETEFFDGLEELCRLHFGKTGGDYAYGKIERILHAYALELKEATNEQ
jgi:hypothetical protein